MSFVKIWFTLSIEPQGLRKANFKVRAAKGLSSFKCKEIKNQNSYFKNACPK